MEEFSIKMNSTKGNALKVFRDFQNTMFTNTPASSVNRILHAWCIKGCL